MCYNHAMRNNSVILALCILGASFGGAGMAEASYAPQRPRAGKPQQFDRVTDIGAYRYPDRPGRKNRDGGHRRKKKRKGR